MVTKRKPSAGRHSAASSRQKKTVSPVPLSGSSVGAPRRTRQVNFSSERKSRQASRSSIETFVPNTQSGETRAQHTRRMNQRGQAQAVARKSFAKGLTIGLICLVAAVALAAFAGITTLLGGIDKKNALSDEAKNALVPLTEEDTISYTLFAADLDKPELPKAQDGPDLIMLLRVDKEQKVLSYLMVPSNIHVELTDAQAHPIREAQTLEGDASFIAAVSSFTGADINHYVKSDAEGIVSIVDALGGIDVEISEEVDDPDAGDRYLSEGVQTLSGEDTLTLLRASNFSNTFETQALNRARVVNALLFHLFGQGSTESVRLMDKVAGTFQIDVGIRDFKSLAATFSDGSAVTVYAALVPGYVNSDDPLHYYVYTSEWNDMLQRLGNSEDPNKPIERVTIDRSTASVTVRNGSGSTGAAAKLAETLSALGYEVGETGNTNAQVYEETLVIFKDAEQGEKAQALVDDMGIGRPVQDVTGFYEFEDDVLVIIGTDWMSYE